MSRWTIPWAWAASSPRAAWIRQSIAWTTGSGPPLADDAVEVAPLDVFHDQEVDAAVLVGVERGDDVGVLEPAGGLDLAPEPQDGLRSRANEGGRILSATTSAQPAMPRLEDHAHAALAELVEDQVVADEQAPRSFSDRWPPPGRP